MPIKIDSLIEYYVSSLPAVYHQLREALADDDKTSGDIAKIIAADSGFSARLLKIVNSPFYGCSSRVETISHALDIVGLRELNYLMLAPLLVDKFRGIPSDLVDMESFWRHSIASGVIAKEITRLTGKGDQEQIYIAGMLHDIGTLVLFNKEPGLARKILLAGKTNNENLFQAEARMLGFTHAELGGRLFQSWRLPPRLVEVAAFHHNPLAAKNFPMDAGIVHIADSVAQQMELGSSGEPFPPPMQPQVLERLGLAADFWQPLQEKILEDCKTLMQTIL